MQSPLWQAVLFVQSIIITFFNFPVPGLGSVTIGWLFLGGIGVLFVFNVFRLIFGGGDIRG